MSLIIVSVMEETYTPTAVFLKDFQGMELHYNQHSMCLLLRSEVDWAEKITERHP